MTQDVAKATDVGLTGRCVSAFVLSGALKRACVRLKVFLFFNCIVPMEKTGCEIICGAPTTLAVKG